MDAPPPRRTLMDKWKEHYETKDQMFKIRPQVANRIGVIFFWCFSLSMMYTALNIMIPQLARYEADRRFWMKTMAWGIFVQTAVNWILTSRKSISQVNAKSVPQGNEKLVTSLPQGWKSCPTCQLDSPPRAHHCKICDMCVLKRDHHCFFTGSCIAFYNQRYFIVFSFYATLGTAFGIYLICGYLADPLPFWSRHCVSYFFPVAFTKFILGYMSTAHLLLVAQLNANVICLFGTFWFTIWELFMVFRGQTSFEAMRGMQRYRMSVTQNLGSVFGSFWILNFLIPLPTSQSGNGVDWTIKGTGKNH